jgi:hypothetical protein
MNDKKAGSLICAVGSETASLQDDEIRNQLKILLDMVGPKEDVLLLPVRSICSFPLSRYRATLIHLFLWNSSQILRDFTLNRER